MTVRDMCLCAFALTSMLTFAGCKTAPTPQPKIDVAADIKAINAGNDQWTTAFNSNDAAALAAIYTDDAIRLLPNQAAVEGKQAIQAAFEAMFKENAVKCTLNLLETQVAGDWAYGRGNYTLTVTPKSGKPTEYAGKYLEIFRRQPDGSWKCYRAIWNSNNPTPSAAATKK